MLLMVFCEFFGVVSSIEKHLFAYKYYALSRTRE